MTTSSTNLAPFLNPFTGDTGLGGAEGLVPAPPAGSAADNDFLSADGTWKTIAASYRPVSNVVAFINTNTALTGLTTVLNSAGTTITLVNGDLVCLSNQTTPLQNARYVFNSGNLTLASDCATGSNQQNTIFFETSTGNEYGLTSPTPVIVGTDVLNFTLLSQNQTYFADQVTLNLNTATNIFSILNNGVSTNQLAVNCVTYARMQQATALTLLGNPTSGTANLQELTLTPSLVFSGTTLGTAQAITIASNVVFAGLKATSTLQLDNGGGVNYIATSSDVNGSFQWTQYLSLTSQVNGVLQAAQFPSLSGDGSTTTGSLVFTLAAVNSGGAGSFGSSTSIPSFTVDTKGRITATGSNVVIAPAGTLTGTTLNSTVVSSSLTSVGILTNLAVGGALVSSSIFTLTSTTAGMLFPRVTTTQRNAISSPAVGLTIYNLTNLDLETYNGSAWVGAATSGVTAIAGTANQVLASSSIGNVVLSLPQSIGTSNDVAFNTVQTTNGISAGGGLFQVNGTGTILDGIWHGTAINGNYLNYNTTNLKVTSNQINSIQDIATTSNLQFSALGLGIIPSYPLHLNTSNNSTGFYLSSTLPITSNVNNPVGIYNTPTSTTTAASSIGFSFLNLPYFQATGAGTWTNAIGAQLGCVVSSGGGTAVSLVVNTPTGGASNICAYFSGQTNIGSNNYNQSGSLFNVGTTNQFQISSTGAAILGSSAGGSTTIFRSTDGGSNNETLQFNTSFAGVTNPILSQFITAPDNTGGRLLFSTAQVTTGVMTERMRMDSAGTVYLKSVGDNTTLVFGPATSVNRDYCSMIRSISNIASNYSSDLVFYTHAGSSNFGDPTERVRINSLGDMETKTGNNIISQAGKGYQIKIGSNCRMGTFTLSGGSAVVSNTSVTANSYIFLTSLNSGGALGALAQSNRVVNSSFTVISSSGSDSSTCAYVMFEAV